MAKYPKTLGRIEAVWNKLGGEEGVDRFLSGALLVVKATIEVLLGQVGTVSIPATSKFLASDFFTTNNKEVKIGYVSDNFKKNFSGKVEKAQAETTLRISKLKKDSLDKPIMAELGDKKETTLANIWELLKKQANGESGKLLTNGWANIFYVRDAKGVLWAVDVGWDDDGWFVSAYSVAYPSEWSGGRQVFSRNS